MEAERPIWERMEGEPSRWFDRFDRYRLLGPSRSIEAVWRAEKGSNGNQREGSGGRWYEEAKRWRWRERAGAWDDAERMRRVDEWEASQRQFREAAISISGRGIAKASQALDAAVFQDLGACQGAIDLASDCYDLAERAIGGGMFGELEKLTRRVRERLDAEGDSKPEPGT